MKNYFVTAISTDSGKTVVSALLSLALKSDYWKPIQAGIEEKDIDGVKKITGDNVIIHKEAYCFKTPMSPHAAADIENIRVDLSKVNLPVSDNGLIVEGAGGVLVPLNDKETILDLITHLGLEVILVSNYYLGSINHTLLTVEVLKAKGVKVAGIVFNGEEVSSSKEVILKMTGLTELFSIGKIDLSSKVEVQTNIDSVKKSKVLFPN